MLKPKYSIGVGLMSGTSLDGVDLCAVEFKDDDFSILCTKHIPYSDFWVKQLKSAPSLSGYQLTKLHTTYGIYLGELIRDFIAGNTLLKVDFIASHGHTVFHDPKNGFGLQIGSGHAISAINKLTTVNNFRALDIALGGQGAPLVPIGDRDLFSSYDACLNLGGFANISFYKSGERLACDICPVNIVLNELSENLGFPYDKGGQLAKQGKLLPDLLIELNELPYYKKHLPKSLCREWVVEFIIPLLKKEHDSKDLLFTFVEHIVDQLLEYTNTLNLENVLVTGGGTFNTYLIEKLQSKTTALICVPSNQIIEFKEALLFAYLGFLRLNGKINTLSSVTGALKDSSGGSVIFK